jgi:hypothetical protein
MMLVNGGKDAGTQCWESHVSPMACMLWMRDLVSREEHAKLGLKPNADRSKSKAHSKSAFPFHHCSTSQAQRRDRGVKLGPIRSGIFVVSPFCFGVARFGRRLCGFGGSSTLVNPWPSWQLPCMMMLIPRYHL